MPISLDVQTVSPLGAKSQTYIMQPEFVFDEQGIPVTVKAKTLISYFDPEYLQDNRLVSNTATGRGTVYFFTLNQNTVVLRHYYRGGLIAKLVKDQFIFAGLENTRAYRELKILTYLHQGGVNVPKPIAAKVKVLGMTYQADIITQAVDGGTELHSLLQHKRCDDAIWQNLGIEIAKMHKMRACHDDINVKNILVMPDNKIILLDFDACQVKSGQSWKSKNLARLRRSLEKQQKRHSDYHFEASQWDIALEAYEKAQ